MAGTGKHPEYERNQSKKKDSEPSSLGGAKPAELKETQGKQ